MARITPETLIRLVRVVGSVGAFGLFSACQAFPQLVPETPVASASANAPRAPRQAQLYGGAFKVAGPKGYCIDTAALQDSFVLLAECNALEGRRVEPGQTVPAILTLSASEPLDDVAVFDPSAAAAFFATQNGRTALSRVGNGDTVTVLETQKKGATVFVHASDSAPANVPGLAGEYWRAVFVQDGRLVTLTATGLRAAPVEGAVLARLLAEFSTAIRASNR
ncbi:hypothetical protein [Celeribacter arenosi]|uniref:Dihydroxy-acid dehydratase n=1 Tax=Celeribacter arenosi TaxID=792649 RepID=A0ABP7JZ10_9RHOB